MISGNVEEIFNPDGLVGGMILGKLSRALLEDAEKSCREDDRHFGSMDNLEWVRRALGLEK